MSTSPLEFDHIVIPNIIGKSILDVGCGYGKWGFLVKAYFWLTKSGDFITQPYVVGIDLFYPHLPRLKLHKIYDGLVMASASYLPFRNKSFETVLAIEIIEHLSKDQGKCMISELERVASRCVILSMPNFKNMRGG